MAGISEFAAMLGFSLAWFELGVVDEKLLSKYRDEWDKGEDDNAEHHRYRSFRDFLAKRHPLTPELATALFDLGANDPDQAMGGSMMADIVRLPECPADVLNAALASNHPYLVRIVHKRKAEIG